IDIVEFKARIDLTLGHRCGTILCRLEIEMVSKEDEMTWISPNGIMVMLRQICMMRMCSCPIGTHAWNARQGENNHTFPHDPATDARTDAWRAEMRAASAAWKQQCKDMGWKHWSEKHGTSDILRR